MEHGPLNPWLSMWTRPRATMRRIVDTDPRRGVLFLAAISGFGESLNRASMRSFGDRMELGEIFLVAAIAGPISGLITLLVSGWLLAITGRWLGGVADSVRMRAAIAWGSVVFLWGMLLWIPELLMVGSEMFTTEMPTLDASPDLAYAMLGLGILEIVVGIWGLVAYLKCIGEVQEFSAWRALGSILLAVAVVGVVGIIIVFTVMFLGGSL